MTPFIDGRPHTSTTIERIANGVQALKISLGVCRRAGVGSACAPAVGGRSFANRQARFGCQNRRKITVAVSDTTPPAMSTRFESTWLDQRYCVRLKDPPTTRMAGGAPRGVPPPPPPPPPPKGTMNPVIGRKAP